MNPNPEHKTV